MDHDIRKSMTVREWFRLNRATRWEAQPTITVEIDTLANAIVDHDDAMARAVLGWLLADQPYKYSQLRERHRHQNYRGITR